MTFVIISSIILFGLSILCFWLPYKSGQKKTGLFTSIIFGIVIVWTLIDQLDFLVIFIWPIVLGFQIIFLSYWVFRLYGHKKIAAIIAIVNTTVFILIALQPWIDDWTFTKSDAIQILNDHSFVVTDEIELVSNESGGFLDYYHIFEIGLSDKDYDEFKRRITNSNNYLGKVEYGINQPFADYHGNDTINYETEYNYTREYYTKDKMEDGTYHFVFILFKNGKKLKYIGSNE